MKKTTLDKPIIISLKKFGFDQELLIKTTTNKNSYLRLDRNNNIVFSKSIYMSDAQSEEFIRKNINKLINSQRINQENIPYNLKQGWVILFGRYYNLNYIGSGRGFDIKDKEILIKGKNIELAFANFCKAQEKLIIKLANHIAIKVGINTLFKVKLLKAVWGNCTPLKKTISLNKRLIFFQKRGNWVCYISWACPLYPPTSSKRILRFSQKMMPRLQSS